MPMPIIERRRIEAEIVGHIDRELVERIGREALEIEVKEVAPDRLTYIVTRCRYAETYREMGLAEIGALMSCNRDAAFSLDDNPAMTLEHRETLMNGGRRRDFRYRLDTPGGQ